MARVLKIVCAAVGLWSAAAAAAEPSELAAVCDADCEAEESQLIGSMNTELLQLDVSKVLAHEAGKAEAGDAEVTKVADAEKAADPDQCGLASHCNTPEDCKEFDCCQKLGNDGGHPLGGTLKCRGCHGDGRKSFKCQVWPGQGSARTCGCTTER
mmetsp:Transcript_12123/g.31125  ORF Transcript_12123/g.31125 Transcript_12123/m.31125 type:complete len:155 (-) Transcript_12123:100-564(-)